jgi:hypothetical protein
MRFLSMKSSLVLLTVFGNTVAADKWIKRTDNPPVHSEPHTPGEKYSDFGYCEKFVQPLGSEPDYGSRKGSVRVLPQDFENLCKTIDNTLTLPARDISKLEDD